MRAPPSQQELQSPLQLSCAHSHGNAGDLGFLDVCLRDAAGQPEIALKDVADRRLGVPAAAALRSSSS